MIAGPDAVADRRPIRLVPLVLFGAVFAIAYCQAPLYYSNQNQYFLHGLANAGEGLLRDDWLAKTRDPTPVFSALVTFTVRYLGPWAFYLYYGVVLAAYAAAMLGLFVFLAGRDVARRRWPVFIALFVAIHSALARWCSFRWLGQDYPWFFQAGVAGQYVLGGYLQPSAFGALLVVAVCLFVHGRFVAAGVCTALAAVFHPSYLLPAGLLTLGFVEALVAERRTRQGLVLGAVALVLVAPVVTHVALVFGPTDATTFAEAENALVNVRIPHHTRVDLWLDLVAGLQIGWVLLGVALTWDTRLFLVLAVPFALSALLTVAQVVTGSNTLALLFPWRISAVLVPVATTVILSRIAAAPFRQLDGTVTRIASAVTILVCVAAGVWITVARLGFHNVEEEAGVMEYVRRNKKEGDVYWLPVTVPKAPTRGSLSSDFEPLSAKKKDMRVIQVNLQRFRLYTGAPIYVDFKAVPYKDAEVVEWQRRIRVTEEIRAWLPTFWGRDGQLVGDDRLRREGITHLVLPDDEWVRNSAEVPVFEDAHYRIYRVPPRIDAAVQ
jgi:hypothetical protein